MANRAMPIESAAAPVSPALFTQSSRTGWLCQCLRGQDLEEESGGPFALLAHLARLCLCLRSLSCRSLKARLRATAGAPGTGRETQGAVVNGTLVCKGLAGAELMAREATPTPKAAKALSRANLPWGAD